MNASVSPLPVSTPVAKFPMQVAVVGRVESSHRHENKTYTRVICPAVDAYSKPQLVNLRSGRSIGRAGDEVSVLCTVGGYARRPFETKDKETGEIVRVVPVEHTLDVVEG